MPSEETNPTAEFEAEAPQPEPASNDHELFGFLRGSVIIPDGVDLTESVLEGSFADFTAS
jgi:hypothetical protein